MPQTWAGQSAGSLKAVSYVSSPQHSLQLDKSNKLFPCCSQPSALLSQLVFNLSFNILWPQNYSLSHSVLLPPARLNATVMHTSAPCYLSEVVGQFITQKINYDNYNNNNSNNDIHRSNTKRFHFSLVTIRYFKRLKTKAFIRYTMKNSVMEISSA